MLCYFQLLVRLQDFLCQIKIDWRNIDSRIPEMDNNIMILNSLSWTDISPVFRSYSNILATPPRVVSLTILESQMNYVDIYLHNRRVLWVIIHNKSRNPAILVKPKISIMFVSSAVFFSNFFFWNIGQCSYRGYGILLINSFTKSSVTLFLLITSFRFNIIYTLVFTTVFYILQKYDFREVF